MVGAEVAACLIGGLPEDLFDVSRLDEKADVLRPVVRLAALLAGTWYIDVIASFAEFRGYGLGSKLSHGCSLEGRGDRRCRQQFGRRQLECKRRTPL